MKKLFICLILMVFLASFVSAEISYCCEKTKSGAWCQNAPENECDTGNNCGPDGNCRKVPTSCEATSYCRKGCCYNTLEGTCMENSPQRNCQNYGGVWEGSSADCEIPQCKLGCCVMLDQAAFVTQTRCKRLSALYGLETDFRTDISSEIQCILSTTSEVKGACVFEKEFERTCLFITQRECQEMGYEGEDSNAEFFPGKLCSDERLGTNCGPSEKTTCLEGRDEVYFLDTCGNLANIYDASKIKDKMYWSEVKDADETCGSGSSNANSATCGNCNYYLGSTCKQYKRGETARPQYGDYICKDLSCEYENREYQHGETWCVSTKGTDQGLPGSRYFRLVCYNGDVTVEPCADYRQEVCLQDSVNNFRVAACRANMWQECISINDSKDCENTDKRDCKWIGGKEPIKCIPLYKPGFDFWNAEGDAESLCGLADQTCTITFVEKLTGSKKCEKNCQCENVESWRQSLNDRYCTKIGDCGVKRNYIGLLGYNTISDAS